MRRKLEEEGEEEVQAVGNALEMAILSKSKRFIKSPSCQKGSSFPRPLSSSAELDRLLLLLDR